MLCLYILLKRSKSESCVTRSINSCSSAITFCFIIWKALNIIIIAKNEDLF